MRRGFIYALALVTGAALAVSAARLVASNNGNGDVEVRTPITRIVPAPGQSFVSGEIDFLSADGAQTAPIPAPFTLTALDQAAGPGKGTIENALVGGKRSTIFWGGGTPLPLLGVGGVDVNGSTVELAPSGITWTISGGRRLLPGEYEAGAPVAVGSTGLGTPRDAVAFTADARTVLNTSAGVVIELEPQRLEVTGPGRVSARGKLTITDAAGTHSATKIDFATGPYKVTVVTQGSKLVLDATLQGPLTAT